MGNTISGQAGAANIPFGTLVVESLARLGVAHFVVSPGSRSTPPALAAASLGEDRSTMVLDERSAAFHALGRIKATGRPVALICTSGTAGAHYYPAVIEAREAALPLVVLTCDRPPELRHCHAGQTIDQLKLFGTYPLFHAEMPLPEPDEGLMRQTREICRRAIESAMGIPPGPVHLNCPYREPFFPVDADPEPLDRGLYADLETVPAATPQLTRSPRLPQRTVILAGPRPWRDPETEMEAVLALSAKTGFPILADGSNPLRYRERTGATVIIHYDRIARQDSLWESLKPEACVLWGEPPTSKVLREKLAECDLPGYQIGSGKPGMNPFGARLQWLGCAVSAFSEPLKDGSDTYAASWREADVRMEAALAKAMDPPHALFEGDIHRLLGDILPPGAPIFFASSLAIRDADWFMPGSANRLVPYCQRGANGIDGTLSLARGVAAGGGEAAYLVTGDLAFLHDSNGLLGSRHDRHGLLVLLINNEGGGIFEFLPVARMEVDFERLFATPQSVDFEKLVEAHGGHYRRASSLEGIRETVSGWNGKGLTVVEIPVDRKASLELHKRFLKL